MQITITNVFHNKAAHFRTEPVISVHSAGRLANYSFTLTRRQTVRFFAETCGSKTCYCHKLELSGFHGADFTFNKNGELEIFVLDVPVKIKK
jgi:hypothetical protein